MADVFHGSARSWRRQAFTLIELLAVIGIMALMLTLALPAFSGLGRGSKMQTSISSVRSTLALARQWAITHRERTYVVFPHDDINLYTGTPYTNMALRAYNVFTVKNGYLGEWKYLPTGILFDPTKTLTNNVLYNSNWDTIVSNKVWIGSPNNTVSVWAVTFGPDGWLKENANQARHIEVYLTEALFDETTWTYLPKANGTTFEVDVFPLTGQLKVREY